MSKAPRQGFPGRHTRWAQAAGNCRPRVVVGADASRWGRIALRWAAEHAWLAGAELAVYAAPIDSANAESGYDVGAILRGFPLLPVQVRISRDSTVDLLHASRRADLLVLGCRGSDHVGLGLGATVTPVAAGASCDVMVVGGHPAAVRGAHHQIAVLVGMEDDEAALDSAARLAALRRVPLRILIAAPMMGPHPLREAVDGQLVRLDEAEALVHEIEPAVVSGTDLIRASPHEVVTTGGGADVLVIGVVNRLDAVTRMALHHAPNPVLLARGSSQPRSGQPAVTYGVERTTRTAGELHS